MSYYGPIVAVGVLGVFVFSNSILSAWTPGVRAAWLIKELSDSAFGVFLVHFAIMVALRRFTLFGGADSSLALSLIEWGVVVVASFVLVGLMRRAPLLRKLV